LGVGGLGSVGAKLNVVQNVDFVRLACTSFNFCEELPNGFAEKKSVFFVGTYTLGRSPTVAGNGFV